MSTTLDHHEFVVAKNSSMRPIVFAGVVGTVMEWYDFLIYGTAAALVFNKLFFPNVDPLTGTLASLGTFAVGFFGRPLGAVLFGHFGDRIGRKVMLMLTMIVTAMGTFLVGLLPTYEQIGIWAPILLIALRFLQGVGLGGEWGGASLLVLEHAQKNRRGLYGSLVQVGFPLGMVASYGVFNLVSTLPEADVSSWGWRVPFLLSIVLLGIGWFVRIRVPETPMFEEIRRRGKIVRNPFFHAVLKDPRSFLIALGLKICEVSWVYILTIFVVIYATNKLQLPKSLLLNAIFFGALLEVITIPLFGWISDKLGRRMLYFVGVLFSFCFAFPLFWLLDTRDPQIIIATVIIAMNLGHGTMFGLESTYFPELFGTPVRYTGASFGFQVSAALGGGLSPIIATALVAYLGGTVGVSVMLMVLAIITFVATVLARETKDAALQEPG